MSMRPVIVIDVVGLSPRMIGPDTPHLAQLSKSGSMRPLAPVFPAVTCPVQASFLTGTIPAQHGIVANGWYFRDLSEVWFWRQSNRLIAGERIWDAARRRDSSFTCANLFWWYNMYAGTDIGVTPRPIYLADGRKLPDCYTKPMELRDELTERFGTFPLFTFWGPGTNISSSRWIAQCALHVRKTRRPTLTLIYLPHLDYNLQRVGPGDPAIAKDLRDVDALCGELIEDAQRDGARIVVLSEYGITPVSQPIHINRALRQAGFIRWREECGHEQLDPGASVAFAVSDHQVAHIYVSDPARIGEVKTLIEQLPGVESVHDAIGKAAIGLDHPRSGELVAIAKPDSWFTYYYWLDDAKAPDYARTVDIHRKPGYDPVELFLDGSVGKAGVAWRLAKRKLGLRTLLDVIPLDASLVKGSHGRLTDSDTDGPVFISSDSALLPAGKVAATSVKDLVLNHIFAP